MEGDKAFTVVPISSSKYTWKIPNFSRLSEKKIYSDVFIVGGCKWRLMIFPKGNRGDDLSIYVDVPDSKDLPDGWNRKARLSFSVINHFHKSATVCKDTLHVFDEKEPDWGFRFFIPLSKLKNPDERYLVHDTLTVEGVLSVAWAVHKSKDERAKEEACQEIEEFMRWEAEKKQVYEGLFGAKEKLATANVRWDWLRKCLGL